MNLMPWRAGKLNMDMDGRRLFETWDRDRQAFEKAYVESRWDAWRQHNLNAEPELELVAAWQTEARALFPKPADWIRTQVMDRFAECVFWSNEHASYRFHLGVPRWPIPDTRTRRSWLPRWLRRLVSVTVCASPE